MFEDKYYNYGVIKVDNGMAEVFCGMYDYRRIAMCGKITEAYWSGRSIIIKKEDSPNRIFRFTDWDHYDVIYL